MGHPLEITVAFEGEAAVLIARGEIDMASVATLTGCLDHAHDTGQGPVVVDLAEVTFMDSSGLNALIRSRSVLTKKDRRPMVRVPITIVRRVLAISGLDEDIEMLDEE